MSLDEQERQQILDEQHSLLLGMFPDISVDDIKTFLVITKQIATHHHDWYPYGHLVVEATDENGELVVRIPDDKGTLVARPLCENPKGADALVTVLKALRVPARLKSTKLVGCPICEYLHPTDFNGDCRDDSNRFTTPNNYDDIVERFDNGDPGSDLIDYEKTHERTVFIDIKNGKVRDVRNLPDKWTYAPVGEDDETGPQTLVIAVQDKNKVEVSNLPNGYDYQVYNLDGCQKD